MLTPHVFMLPPPHFPVIVRSSLLALQKTLSCGGSRVSGEDALGGCRPKLTQALASIRSPQQSARVARGALRVSPAVCLYGRAHKTAVAQTKLL